MTAVAARLMPSSLYTNTRSDFLRWASVGNKHIYMYIIHTHTHTRKSKVIYACGKPDTSPSLHAQVLKEASELNISLVLLVRGFSMVERYGLNS